jgi:hypothetical protein
VAKSKHTFAKRQREIEKKRKAEEKRAQRLLRRSGAGAASETKNADEANPESPASETTVFSESNPQ